MVKGQLVEILHQEVDVNDHWWEYGVITNKFDDTVVIRTESKLNIMHHFYENEKELDEINGWLVKNIKVVELFRNGYRVMAKKTLFGKYKFD